MLNHWRIGKRLALGFWVLAALLGLLACHSEAGKGSSTKRERLVITGSSTVAPLVLEMGRRFEASFPGARIDVQTGGSSRGIRDAKEGLADIGMVSRELKDGEAGLTPFTIAYDGIGLIVHADNPVRALSDDQVRAIYTGTVDNWSQLGGPDRRITVVNKAEGRSTLELFLKYYGLKNTEIKAQVVIGDNEQGIKTVAGNPGALGYVSIGTAEYDISQGIAVRLLPIKGVAASRQNVANKTFPLSRSLSLVMGDQTSALARQFIAFAQSEAIVDLVEDMYFVPLSR